MLRSPTVFLAFATLLAAHSAALSTDWKNAGKDDSKSPYPFADLPGVTAQGTKKDEDQYACRTETREVRRLETRTFRPSGIPELVYVCERDGVESVGDQVPLKGHYQPVR
ncbi:hypothetical protein [Oryzifoliimicrobium ureilyticus]|uniref:hypothetical protein n=1 Tax=Oryzifoliimicrobium ureilyticus TaxID=3113724 RepID=UPI0030766876